MFSFLCPLLGIPIIWNRVSWTYLQIFLKFSLLCLLVESSERFCQWCTSLLYFHVYISFCVFVTLFLLFKNFLLFFLWIFLVNSLLFLFHAYIAASFISEQKWFGIFFVFVHWNFFTVQLFFVWVNNFPTGTFLKFLMGCLLIFTSKSLKNWLEGDYHSVCRLQSVLIMAYLP